MRVLCAIFLGSTLLLTVSSAAVSDDIKADVAENADASLLQLLKEVTADSSTQQGASDEVGSILDDLREIAEENDLVPMETDDGTNMTKGCEGHQDGDQWGTPEHENCYCHGQHRFCYRADDECVFESVRDSNGLWDCPDGWSSEDENGLDLEGTDLEGTDLEGTDLEGTDLEGTEDAAEAPLIAEEERGLARGVADDILIKTKGCQDHQVGDQWGTPDHDNCICQGSDRLCYHVDCLPGSKIVSDSNGPWYCDAGLSKKDITGSALVMRNSENFKREPLTLAAVATAAATGLGVVADVLGVVGFIFDRVESAQTTAQLNEIQDQIRALDTKVNELTQSVSDLQLGQQYLQQVILYGRDERRLNNMLDTLANMQVSNGQYTAAYNTVAWADSVLSFGSDGVREVLNNLLNMVKPQSSLFAGKSLFEIYHQQLQGNLVEYREKMPRKVTQVYSLIGGGYAVWITALRIKGRTGEIPAKKDEAVQALNSLTPSLEKYFVYGTCPSGWNRHARTCYKAFTLSKTWVDASAHCSNQGRGGMLAMAKDSGTNSFLINLKNAASTASGFWFGLNDRASEGSYKWPDGSYLGSYKYWSPVEPNNGGKNWWGTPLGNEDCVEFFRKGWRNSNWNDVNCGQRRYFLCERKPNGE
ncbi:uncharacterized protein LOC118403652 [Branchiostoma floridae]|uniref:Uncharacterized protein LOC118403652 n=1 Tax=Branchiostoma floridae TaxID=7739 RepID=A0A9J7KGU6_BRAFL|nr:uncharacterized protein LOC118403652 [Branchiostoma floridae]